MKNKFIAKGKTRFNIPASFMRKNGRVRTYTKALKLPIGVTVVIRDICEETEEGYSSIYELMQNDKGVLYRVIHSDSSDCDGRYSSVKEQKLVNGSWVKVHEGQRDHTAEAAGY